MAMTRGEKGDGGWGLGLGEVYPNCTKLQMHSDTPPCLLHANTLACAFLRGLGGPATYMRPHADDVGRPSVVPWLSTSSLATDRPPVCATLSDVAVCEATVARAEDASPNAILPVSSSAQRTGRLRPSRKGGVRRLQCSSSQCFPPPTARARRSIMPQVRCNPRF